MFTLKNTINEIKSNEVIMKHFDYMMPMFFLDIVPDEMRDLSIGELKDKLLMPWGAPYMSAEIIDVANQLLKLINNKDKYEFVKLWAEETPKDYFPATDGTKDGVGLLIFKESFEPGKPFSLIVPGGGYNTVAVSNEGIFTAEALQKHGYAAAVLNYQCAPNKYPSPQEDTALAIKYLRYRAKKEGLKDELLLVGFSAGGHLAATETCYAHEIDGLLMSELREEFHERAKLLDGISAKADAVCLSYPVIDLIKESHGDTCKNVTGGDELLMDKLSVDLHVKPDYPKTFVWACEDDMSVPYSNTIRMHEALRKQNVKSCCKIYPTGGHGIATAEGTSAEGWVDDLMQFLKE